MEVKTLLRLIKDDISLLEGITGEFNVESLPTSDEIEVALVRANALLKELDLLHKFTDRHESGSKTGRLVPEPTVVVSKPAVSEQKPFEKIVSRSGENEDEVSDNFPPAAHFTTLGEPAGSNDFPAESHVVNEEAVDERLIVMDESANGTRDQLFISDKGAVGEIEVPVAETTLSVEPVEVPESSDHREEVVAEEFKEVKKTLNETLGESHQMVNDMLAPERSESGYKLNPIDSIWDGIGINDRFLYVRELFANNSAKFESTVAALDELESIQDAVNFLKSNFKWNKTVASQKFLVLVKRRFTK